MNYALSRGVTMRDDSILVQPEPRCWYHNEMAQYFWPIMPVILEHEHYGGSVQRKAWDKNLLLKAVEEYHASYMSIHWWPDILLRENKDVIEKIKALDYDEAIETQGEDAVDIGSYKNNNKLIIDNKEYDSAYTIEIKVKKYVPNSNGQENNDSNDLVKIVNVNVLYKIGKEVENVELTTTIVRNR